jgi:hypothetical protein
MNTPLALAASLLAVVLWLVSRRRPQLQQPAVRHSSAAGVAVSQVLANAVVPSTRPPALVPGSSCAGAVSRLSRARLLSQSRAALVASPSERINAMQQLAASADRAVLPLLMRGLRDPHPGVVLAAAQAMERFRGRTSAVVAAKSKMPLKLPRNARPRG